MVHSASRGTWFGGAWYPNEPDEEVPGFFCRVAVRRLCGPVPVSWGVLEEEIRRVAVDSFGEYPDDWEEIATALKRKRGWHCERCGHRHELGTGYVLTVHHLVPDKALCEKWNLAVLCQRCHLCVQARVDMVFEVEQLALWSRTDWLTPHLIGCREWMVRQKGGVK